MPGLAWAAIAAATTLGALGDNGVGVNAHEGRPTYIAAADQLVAIPMHGMVASLNVSVAAAVLLFEAQRQRLDAGFYDAPRLDPETYERTLFEWAYPRLAAKCLEEGTPYPPVDGRE